MWIVPSSISSRFAAEAECLTKDSNSPSNIADSKRVLWVTLSGKATPRLLSWPGWKNRAWSPLLFGAAIWQSSRQTSFTAWWTSLWAESPANPSVSPESKKGSKMHVGSGPSCGTLRAAPEHGSSRLKTSEGLFTLDWNPSLMTLPKAGGLRNGCISEHPKWVPVTSGIGFSYSGWMSPRANESKGGEYQNQQDGSLTQTLTGQAQNWPTPNTAPEAPNNSTNRGNGEIRARLTSQCLGELATNWPSPRAEDSESCGNHPGVTDSLTGSVSQWPTPSANGSEGETSEDLERRGAKLVNRKTGRVLQTNLGTEAKQWSTPVANVTGGDNKTGTARDRAMKLTTQGEQWATPTSSENSNRTTQRAPSHGKSHGEVLAGQAADWEPKETWPTPAARDAKGENGENGENHMATKERPHEDQLANAAVYRFLHPVLSQTSGEPLSPTPRTLRRRLNPAFVCWLMGWPMWWTRAVPTSFGAQETALWRSKLRWHLRCCLGGLE